MLEPRGRSRNLTHLSLSSRRFYPVIDSWAHLTGINQAQRPQLYNGRKGDVFCKDSFLIEMQRKIV